MQEIRKEIQELRQRIDELQEELRILQDDLDPPDNPFIGKYGITGQMAAVLQCLYKSGSVTHQRLDTVTARYQRLYVSRSCDKEHMTRRTNVVVCKLRKILEPMGITIETIRYTGYQISKEHRKKLEQIFKIKESAD